MGTTNDAMFYDPAMFQEAGVPEPEPGYTYEDMEDMSIKIKESFGDGYFGVRSFNSSEYFAGVFKTTRTKFL